MPLRSHWEYKVACQFKPVRQNQATRASLLSTQDWGELLYYASLIKQGGISNPKEWGDTLEDYREIVVFALNANIEALVREDPEVDSWGLRLETYLDMLDIERPEFASDGVMCEAVVNKLRNWLQARGI